MPAALAGCATLWCWIEVSERQGRGVAGTGGWRMADNCVVDSPHILPVMPRRLGTHGSAWISQQPREGGELAARQGAVRNWLGQGVEGVKAPCAAGHGVGDSYYMSA